MKNKQHSGSSEPLPRYQSLLTLHWGVADHQPRVGSVEYITGMQLSVS